MQRFKKLFEPARIGTITVKNRIVMPAMGTKYALSKGYVSQKQIDYYEARAKGGTGLIITEITAPCFSGRSENRQLTISDDSYIPGFRELASAIHRHGARIAVQLHHSGRETNTAQTGFPAVGASPVPNIMGVVPRELTVGEIAVIVQEFAAGAVRAREAGIDGVEIHCAHHYLLATFMSRATNKRTDSYGGSIENRARFTVEIIRAIREAVGPDYPVWVRLNGEEPGITDGVTLDEAKQAAKIFVDAGADAIHVSAFGAGIYSSKAPLPDTPGYLLPLAAGIKEVVNVPVIAVGRMDPVLAEQVLEASKADFVAMGRRLLSDPDLANKALENRLEDVNPCIGCMECLQRGVFSGGDLSCTVNPTMGKERESRIVRVDKAKKILVVGGGPAGMEAARVAALRGHHVTLIEKAAGLGGLLHLAAIPPHKQEITPLIDYLGRQVKLAGIDIRLGVDATPEFILKSGADVVVLAIGGTPIKPVIDGIDSRNVVGAEEVLSGKVTVGKNVVIIGGGIVGCETGHFLVEQGKNVTIIEILNKMAAEMTITLRFRLIHELKQQNVSLLTGVKCESIDASGVTVEADGKSRKIQADTVVIAVGYKPNDVLFRSIEGKVATIYNIGDSAKSGQIYDAILDGNRTGLAI